MAKVKPAPNTDMPVTARNPPKTADLRAGKQLRDMRAEGGSLRAICDELAKRGYAANKGYISNVINGNRHASMELLIALGLRKPSRPPMTEAEKELRREARETTSALWNLHMAAHAGYTVSMSRDTDIGGSWTVKLEHPAFAPIVETGTTFVDAVNRAHTARFTKYIK